MEITYAILPTRDVPNIRVSDPNIRVGDPKIRVSVPNIRVTDPNIRVSVDEKFQIFESFNSLRIKKYFFILKFEERKLKF